MWLFWYTLLVTRQTIQRQVILRVLDEAPGPLTPQELLARAREAHGGLGLATVYRTLSAMEAQGGVVAVHLPNEGTRYEPAGRGHHHHFRCRNCEVVFELPTTCPVVALEGARLPGGFQVTGHELLLSGFCPHCAG